MGGLITSVKLIFQTCVNSAQVMVGYSGNQLSKQIIRNILFLYHLILNSFKHFVLFPFQMLDENSQLIQTIQDYQSKGKSMECLQ